ncbi:MAG: hypothetical protein DYG83_04540 [Candidatus Brocadia sp. AMX2]|nr:hypothetical protein [Candidatus Brocadia sp.]MBL1169378.1 hypothetical protein [Candidatus Brocadia sp. AMX1]MCE7866088.1 hypothetical protein [Candidatus Brocadia sp. AMX2]MCQ3916907.1 hypothetical protein [Candidatus Brocadia sp.]RIJ90162.1 MAG: hypothetical protein DB853_12455 [Candidatus Brocadia sp.]
MQFKIKSVNFTKTMKIRLIEMGKSQVYFYEAICGCWISCTVTPFSLFHHCEKSISVNTIFVTPVFKHIVGTGDEVERRNLMVRLTRY